MPSPWVWDDRNHRYRNTATGRYISARQMVELRNLFVDTMKQAMSDLAWDLAQGHLDATAWEEAMRREIKAVLIDQYVMGHGGRNTMTAKDWGRVGQMLRSQYKFLSGFAKDIEAGRYIDAEGIVNTVAIEARAKMYTDAGTFAFERAHALAYGVPGLPAYPGDGSTQCLTKCRCHWDIKIVEGGWDCTWGVGGSDPCGGCLERSETWKPLHVEGAESPNRG